jgi:hypothetical protein
MIREGDELLQKALEAVLRCLEAKDSSTPACEVERLRVAAESLMQAVAEYQLRSFGGPAHTLH